LEIKEGDFFGIIGHTGSGKSTLVSHLNGLIKLLHGSIVIDEFDLSKKYDYKALRAKVGMVFQYPEYQLFDDTVKSDVGFGPKNLKLPAEEIERRVRTAIAQVGLDYDEVAMRSPFELSGGQMRRVAIAGVIAKKPKILILDEPTAGLDPRGKKQMLSLVHSLKKECPNIIMISHNMDEIFENCNRIALLNKGKLEGVFTPDELFENSNILPANNLEMPSVFSLATNLSARGFCMDRVGSEDELICQIAAEYAARAKLNKKTVKEEFIQNMPTTQQQDENKGGADA
jgi:energy-coupling factor transport system ATP-binding protein